ncbi:uncharacterized protein LOC124166868 [Ischnura elegans]|uniref:uncharacterized protein LOC124166868 n=1 Tax=Ischnura elegans TaxID=197161 RepID=UPI001ED88DAB|nr:uncharacterized protein LOC124166868 [Ischnura elegans]
MKEPLQTTEVVSRRRDRLRDSARDTSMEDEEIGASDGGDSAACDRGLSNATGRSATSAGPHGDRTPPPLPPESPSELPPQWLLSAALVASGNEYRDTASDLELYFRKSEGLPIARVPSPDPAATNSRGLLASSSEPALQHRDQPPRDVKEGVQGPTVNSEELMRRRVTFAATEEQVAGSREPKEEGWRWESNTRLIDGHRQEVKCIPGEREWSPIPRVEEHPAARQQRPVVQGPSRAGSHKLPPSCRSEGLRSQWLQKRASSLEKALKEARAEAVLLRESNQSLRTRLNRSETTNLNKQYIIENCKSQNAELTARQSELEDQKKVLESEIQALKESTIRIKKEVAIQKERLATTEDEKRRLREDLRCLTNDMNTKVSTQSEEMKKMRAEMQSLQERHKERILALEREIQATVHQCQKRINESHRVIRKYMGCIGAKEPSPRDAERHRKHQEETAIKVDQAPADSPGD